MPKDLKRHTTQIDKFKEAAAAAKTDDSEENFDRVLKRVARHKPTDDERKVIEAVDAAYERNKGTDK